MNPTPLRWYCVTLVRWTGPAENLYIVQNFRVQGTEPDTYKPVAKGPFATEEAAHAQADKYRRTFTHIEHVRWHYITSFIGTDKEALLAEACATQDALNALES